MYVCLYVCAMHTNGEMMVNHRDCVSSRKTRTVASLALAFGWWLDKEMLQPSWSFQTLSGQIKLSSTWSICCAISDSDSFIKYVHIRLQITYCEPRRWHQPSDYCMGSTNQWTYMFTPLHTYWLVSTQCGLISGFSLCIIFPLFEAEPNDGSASCWWTVTATVWSTSAKRGRCCRRKAGRCKPPSLPRQAPRLGERWEVDGSYAKGARYG